MDVEAALIRNQDWGELRRYYSSRTGHAWELGWISLLQFKDKFKAIDCFQIALNDPKYEEAAYILLWKMGKRPQQKIFEGAKSLRLYDCFQAGRVTPLIHFIKESTENAQYFSFLLKPHLQKLSIKDVEEIKDIPRSAEMALNLAEVFETKMKDRSAAQKLYEEFLSDPWSQNVISELSKLIITPQTMSKMRQAYQQRDGQLVLTLLKSIHTQVGHLTSPLWAAALTQAIEYDLSHITAHILGYNFWVKSCISPRAIEKAREILFSKESEKAPRFVVFWDKFLSTSELVEIPDDLDPDSRGLWQIRIEQNPGLLSQGLKEFPMEERFLFLWSLRQRETEKKDPRRWPEQEKESSVVRRSLEKAFERSSNKVLWFDRLRASGCSQSFYEFAVARASIPVAWVIEDLNKNFISNSPAIRSFLVRELSVFVPGSETEKTDLLKALSFLTPVEKQQVLLSRFVLAEIPLELIQAEYLDPLWEAQNQVGPEVFARWTTRILDALSHRDSSGFSAAEWRWIEVGWDLDPKECERFAPRLRDLANFPWTPYIEKLEQHKLDRLLITAATLVPDDRTKETILRRLILERPEAQIQQAILSISTEYIRSDLLAELYLNRGQIEKSIEYFVQELELSPILNDQIRLGHKLLNLMAQLTPAQIQSKSAQLETIYEHLVKWGALDQNTCAKLSDLFILAQKFDRAWAVNCYQWNRAQPVHREVLLSKLLERAFQARAIEQTQRLLVDHILESPVPSKLNYEILRVLLTEDSVFKIRHLRREFIEKASQIYPLHRELLKMRASYDYRALLLWESFYGDLLEGRCGPVHYEAKRRYELWDITESLNQVESISHFAKYLDIHGVTAHGNISSHEFYDQAKRIWARVSKSYSVSKVFDFKIVDELSTPFIISFKSKTIYVLKDFFAELDEDSWTILSLGFLQVLFDFQRGLFDERALMQRFFQGMFLSGSAVSKIIRLCVWLCISEGLIEPVLLKIDPESLVSKLPLINTLIVFYLSEIYEHKAKENCIPLS